MCKSRSLASVNLPIFTSPVGKCMHSHLHIWLHVLKINKLKKKTHIALPLEERLVFPDVCYRDCIYFIPRTLLLKRKIFWIYTFELIARTYQWNLFSDSFSQILKHSLRRVSKPSHCGVHMLKRSHHLHETVELKCWSCPFKTIAVRGALPDRHCFFQITF